MKFKFLLQKISLSNIKRNIFTDVFPQSIRETSFFSIRKLHCFSSEVNIAKCEIAFQEMLIISANSVYTLTDAINYKRPSFLLPYILSLSKNNFIF